MSLSSSVERKLEELAERLYNERKQNHKYDKNVFQLSTLASEVLEKKNRVSSDSSSKRKSINDISLYLKDNEITSNLKKFAKEIFIKCDSDKDGILNAKEYNDYFHLIDMDPMDDEGIQFMFECFGVEGKHKGLSLNDFYGFIRYLAMIDRQELTRSLNYIFGEKKVMEGLMSSNPDVEEPSSSNSNSQSNDKTNDNVDDNEDNNNNTISDDELLALRLQLEEQEEFNNRMNIMTNFNQFRLNDDFSDFYDVDDLQIHTLYSSLNDFTSPMFMNSRGYVMDLRNYVDDDELDCSYEGLLRLEERIGNVRHNLDTNLIDKNKVLKYNKDNKEIQETKCSICLLNYEKNDELRKLLCSHTFHKDCIDNWFKNSSTCPICRTDLKEKLKK